MVDQGHGGTLQQGKLLWWGGARTVSVSTRWSEGGPSDLSAVVPGYCGALVVWSSEGAQHGYEEEEKGVAAVDWECRRGAAMARYL